MQLKRGIERASCDFCHRRKIKCDRSSRISSGHGACSPCALRQALCRVDDSDDIRLQRRRERNVRHTTVDTGNQNPYLSAARIGAQPMPQDTQTGGSSASLPIPPTQMDVLPPLSTENTPGTWFLDDLELSANGTDLLDQVFGWDASLAMNFGEGHGLNEGIDQSDSVPENEGNHEGFWQTFEMDSAIPMNAMQAYFKFAALTVPIIFEDAFWKDYHEGHCSRSLVYAIACLGMPFTSESSKWHVQQQLAHSFREALFESHADQLGLGLGRLDDLEALALMVGFEYGDAHTSPLQKHLQDLLITHDSLVLMTLKFSRNPESAQSNASLARAEERRTLLLWHVYGLDAFEILDTKGVSRISDQEIELVPDLLRQISGGYLDAILALAVVARRIMQTLYTVTARRKGVKSQDLLVLYAQLEDWRRDSCPTHLRRPGDQLGEVATSESDGTGNQLQLHRATLWILETNCYMQIESIVQELGIQDESGFGAELVALRVEQASLQAVQDVLRFAPWLKRREGNGEGGSYHSLIDLSPILRDICAGLCLWICARGQKSQQSNYTYRLRAASEQRNEENSSSGRGPSKYKEMAMVLRDAVATATSHHDTQRTRERLDEQILSLDRTVRK